MSRDRAFSYDELPYAGHPHPDAHPERAGAIARLFGVDVVPLEGARVLELGCGEGDDLLPLAAAFPDATFVGVDLGTRHVEVATSRARRRGLANVRFVRGDVADLAEDLGTFDYVVANGLYSWVPEAVADAVLAVCARSLTDRGIAYVSYNTLPGWEELGVARAAFRAHVDSGASPREQVVAARAFLASIADTRADDPTSRSLRRVAARVEGATDSYVFHEFLCEDNHPVWFAEFVRRAGGHGLRYVGDALASAMWGAGAEPAGDRDRIADEQRLDRVNDRGFRGSILCRSALDVASTPDAGALRHLALGTRLTARGDGAFAGPDGLVLHLEGDGIVAAMSQLVAARGRAVPFDPTWCGFADAATVVDDLFSLVQAGLVEIRLPGGPEATHVEERPRAFPGALADLAEGRTRVGGLRHVSVDLDPGGRVLLPLLDGTNDRDALAAGLRAAVERGDLDLGSSTRTSDTTLRAQVEAWLEHALSCGLLVRGDG